MKPAFKPCNCPLESWEEIVVDRDEQFEERSTIYYSSSNYTTFEMLLK